jgi:hypothetical protein
VRADEFGRVADHPYRQPAWPRYTSGRLMSLRPGDQTQTITAATYGAEHQCSFWNAGQTVTVPVRNNQRGALGTE